MIANLPHDCWQVILSRKRVANEQPTINWGKPMSNDWFIQVMGESQGPLTAAQLRKLASSGTVNADTLVRRGPTADWVLAGRVQGLFAPPNDTTIYPSPPPPLPPNSGNDHRPAAADVTSTIGVTNARSEETPAHSLWHSFIHVLDPIMDLRLLMGVNLIFTTVALALLTKGCSNSGPTYLEALQTEQLERDLVTEKLNAYGSMREAMSELDSRLKNTADPKERARLIDKSKDLIEAYEGHLIGIKKFVSRRNYASRVRSEIGKRQGRYEEPLSALEEEEVKERTFDPNHGFPVSLLEIAEAADKKVKADKALNWINERQAKDKTAAMEAEYEHDHPKLNPHFPDDFPRFGMRFALHPRKIGVFC